LSTRSFLLFGNEENTIPHLAQSILTKKHSEKENTIKEGKQHGAREMSKAAKKIQKKTRGGSSVREKEATASRLHNRVPKPPIFGFSFKSDSLLVH